MSVQRLSVFLPNHFSRDCRVRGQSCWMYGVLDPDVVQCNAINTLHSFGEFIFF